MMKLKDLKMKKIKNHFKKIAHNYNWERRYKNLKVKYDDLILENERLNELLDEDNNLLIIKGKNKTIKMLTTQRNNLRKEIKKYQEDKNVQQKRNIKKTS